MSAVTVTDKVSAGFTAAVADAVADVRFDALPAEVIERTRHMLLDWLAVSIAGAQQPSARAAARVAAAEGGNPLSSVLGTSLRLGPQHAALVNGVAAHALDYDDGSRWAGAHPSAPVVSAAVALGEARGLPGDQIVTAIVAGVQGLCLIGHATGPSHYAKGFHTTGTIGAFGASAGCARLLHLDARATARALGLAATQAAGLKTVFGTMGKHLNAGRAAANGVLAACLAAEGFDAPQDAIEARQGFAWTQSTSFDPARRKDGGRFGVEQVLFKRYACCADTHSAIEGIRAVAARRRLTPATIAGVHLGVSDGLLDVCDIASPTSGAEAKFSVRYATALAILGAALGPSDFTDAAIGRPDAASLLSAVTVEAVRNGHASDPIEVTVRFTDGTTETALVNPLVPVPADELPQQWNVLSAKFDDLVVPVLGAERAASLRQSVREVDRLGSIAVMTKLATLES